MSLNISDCTKSVLFNDVNIEEFIVIPDRKIANRDIEHQEQHI